MQFHTRYWNHVPCALIKTSKQVAVYIYRVLGKKRPTVGCAQNPAVKIRLSVNYVENNEPTALYTTRTNRAAYFAYKRFISVSSSSTIGYGFLNI